MKNVEPIITTYNAWYGSSYPRRALKQGWALTFLGDTSVKEIMTISHFLGTGNMHSTFSTNEQAYEFVKQQAEKGDELALTALNILLIEKLAGD